MPAHCATSSATTPRFRLARNGGRTGAVAREHQEGSARLLSGEETTVSGYRRGEDQRRASTDPLRHGFGFTIAREASHMTRPTFAVDDTLDVTTRGVAAAVADDPVLSPQEVSVMLGGIPVATLKRWRTERTGPVALHIGRHVRYRRSAVEAWLQARDRDAATWMTT